MTADPSMKTLSVSLDAETVHRLHEVAARMNISVDTCTRRALTDFLDTWEDFLASMDRLRVEDVSGGTGRFRPAQTEPGGD